MRVEVAEFRSHVDNIMSDFSSGLHWDIDSTSLVSTAVSSGTHVHPSPRYGIIVYREGMFKFATKAYDQHGTSIYKVRISAMSKKSAMKKANLFFVQFLTDEKNIDYHYTDMR